jgi:hypothetical protein
MQCARQGFECRALQTVANCQRYFGRIVGKPEVNSVTSAYACSGILGTLVDRGHIYEFRRSV